MPIITIQQRIREVGRIRIGDRGPKGEPRKLTTFRFTSFDKRAIEAAAQLYGGTCAPCTDKDLKGQFEVTTNASEVPIMASNLDATQYMELWSGGGCQRRCDGQTELLSGEPCKCEAGAEECKPTTRLPVILPDLPGLGVWRLETKGWNAAAELVQSFDMLRSLNGRRDMAEGLLGIEERSGKKDGKTVRYMVPVIRISTSPRELLAASAARTLAERNGEPVGGHAALPERSAHETDGHVLKQPNPRGAAFALAAEMGLPPHENGHKEMYYSVYGKVLGRELTTLADVDDVEWQKIAAWLTAVRDGDKAMPAAFKNAIAATAYDPMADDGEDAGEPVLVGASDEAPADRLV